MNIFKEASIFLIVNSIYLLVDFAFFRQAELEPACILLLINTFLTRKDLIIRRVFLVFNYTVLFSSAL